MFAIRLLNAKSPLSAMTFASIILVAVLPRVDNTASNGKPVSFKNFSTTGTTNLFPLAKFTTIFARGPTCIGIPL